ncbi:MAG TPA: site-specific integrase [Terriglobia bacterium]|nr:site-specific integrase [Terriglobia bacterium]
MANLTKRIVEGLLAQDRAYDVRDSALRGFLIRVEPGGTKSFFLDYRLAGKRSRYRLGVYPNLSVDGARTVALATAGDIARGIDPQARKKAERAKAARQKVSTLKSFLDARYEPWAKTHLKSATFQLARIRSDFADQLDKQLSALNTFAVERIRHDWKKAGMKPRSINRDIQRLQSVLSRAVQWGVLEEHPLKGFKPMKADKTGRVRFLTSDEEAALRAALEDRETKLKQARIRFNTWRIARGKAPLPERPEELIDHLRPLVILALNTGLRRGELLGLKWGSINMPAKMLTVTAATAKSGHTRRVPLNAEALAVVTSWNVRQGKPGDEKFVFGDSEGERMSRIDTAWRSLVATAGLKDFRLHDCRHHFASKLVQAGVDLYTVKELLGHSEVAMTERYAHLAPDNLASAVAKVSGL